MIFVGVDWAEAHHDVYVEDEDGKRLGGGRLPEGVEGIARFHDLVGDHVEEPGEVVIGIETDRGLFVTALVAAGYEVFAVNPMSTSRYRDRHSTSGAKSDPGDAKVLADMVRTDRHNHRPVAADSETVQALKVLARAHQSMVWSRTAPDEPAALDAAGVLPRRAGRFRRPGQRRCARSAPHGAHPGAGSDPVTVEDRRRLAPRRATTPDRRPGGRDPGRPARRAARRAGRLCRAPWERRCPPVWR